MKYNNTYLPLRGLSSLYLAAFIASFYGLDAKAEDMKVAPRLVVNIAIDQLRTDYLDHFSPIYRYDGFRKLFQEGRVYETVSYPFAPVDRASAVASLATGASPQLNHIVAQRWLKRETLRPEYCVSDKQYTSSPAHLASTTISDELKIATDGKAIVYSIAQTEDAAILSVGHAADGAFWLDEDNKQFVTSSYYSPAAQNWVKMYNGVTKKRKTTNNNEVIAEAALRCVTDNAMGQDLVTDYLSITLSAEEPMSTGVLSEMEWVYTSLDATLGRIVRELEQKVGENQVLFVISATGTTNQPNIDYERYHIPTGTFYINRSAQLLNMYLGAFYGIGTYVETYFKNQIFLNHKLIEDKKISYSEIIQRSKDLLMMTSGVASVSQSPYDLGISGDLWVEVSPAWKIHNEDTHETYDPHEAFVSFPVIFLGANIKAEKIALPVTTDRIAPTICRSIHIRAPNGCKAAPLF